MAMSDHGRLEVHVRRVASGSGAMASEHEVYCPHRDRSLAVGECEKCTDYVGTGVDASSGKPYVECKRLTVESARSLRAARRAFLERKGSDPVSLADRVKVTAIMTSDVLCVRENLELDELRDLFARRGVSGMPVVNSHGEPLGMVSTADLVQAPHRGKVEQVMTHLTFSLPDTATVSQAAALMALEHIHRVPITSEDGKVIGLVSSLDVLRWLAQADGYLVPSHK
jgi:CBS domain-containing protein